MREWIDVGPSPTDEPCEQYPDGDPSIATREMNALINQIRRVLGQEPDGARLGIKRDPSGGYREVVCFYDTENQAAIDYAFKCESECPERWDQEARIYLGRLLPCDVWVILEPELIQLLGSMHLHPDDIRRVSGLVKEKLDKL